MRKNLQRKVILRFILAWITLSIILGSFVYWLESERVDELVARLALNDSKLFTSFSQKENWQQEAQKLIAKDFLMVELYNPTGQRVVQVTSQEGAHLVETLEVIPHPFHLAQPYYYKTYFLNKRMLTVILVPVYDDYHQLQGYFEGVYEIPKETLKIISGRVMWSLLEILFVTSAVTLVFYPIFIHLNKESNDFSFNLLKANMDMLKVLGTAISKRDSDTNIHNYRVTILSVRLGEAYGLTLKDMQSLIKGSFLHDVGKIGIQDEILLKPGRLTEAEFQAIQLHVQHGLDIVGHSDWLKDAEDIVRYHHEHYDGQGYLAGLKGNEIPLGARIFALIDVFEALTSKRPYKEPYSLQKSLKIIVDCRGSHFDPKIVDLFIHIAPALYEKVCLAEDWLIERELAAIWREYFYDA